MSRLFLKKFDFIYLNYSSYKEFGKKNFILKNVFANNYIYFDHIFLINYNLLFSRKFYLFTRSYIQLYKNFLNFFFTYLQYDFRFLTLDLQHNMFNTLNFSMSELLKFNYFLNTPQKILKKQQFLLLFRNFIVSSNIKLIIIFDFEVYNNFLNFFNNINVYTMAFITTSHNTNYLDFFIFKSYYFNTFEKSLHYSSLYILYNIVIGRKLNMFKSNYLKIYSNIKLISIVNTPNKYLQPLIHPINIYNH